MQEAVETAFDRNTTAEEIASQCDLTGKNIIITGANSGLGLESARVLGAAGASITLAVRNIEAGAQAVAELEKQTGLRNFQASALDLASKDSIHAFASRYLQANNHLDVLLSNAGIMGVQEAYIDGLESQMAVNFLGHFLLSALLAPLLKSTPDSRVVTLTSIAHRLADVDFDDFNFEKTPYHPMLAYGRSKTATALLAVALDERLAPFGVTSLAVHPGVIHETGLNRSMDEKTISMIAARADGSEKSVETGSATSVWAVTSEALRGKGGLYLEDCQVAELRDNPDFRTGVLPHALSPEAANRLWAQAEQWLSHSYDLS
ncbi:SDR family NAD(P)-dependent oxidoreductase [Halioglobus maricola]|uniref:SDR family NAD(P)-dependent oxidoreductase n=1 Tax=Halioglobus maricola TaxID=2601894 RepID=A0A5P9NJQ8_9GAMM|nr:SDR family NAD(P)-dependent oxidoreductase [Halioglobus maricola]QFU75765.1 SDR family NAD(P)-dependent oxidoreductase [Halioglobus maricola]